MKNKSLTYLKQHSKSASFRISAAISATSVVILTIANAHLAFATTMSNLTVLETNMNASGTSALIVSFKAGAADNSSVVLGLGSATTAVAASPAVGTSYNSVDCKTITGAGNDLPGTLATSGNTNPTITITGGTVLTSGQSYCFVVGTYAAQTAVTNSATPNPYAVTLTDGTDSGSASIDIISNDQVTVNATVPASFTMTIQNTTDNFGSNLATGSVGATSGDNITVNTNAHYGWNLWASDSNIGLHSAVSGATIPSKTPGTNGTITAGTEGYLTAIPAANITQGAGSGGTTSATTAYASSGSGNGSGLNTTPAIIASSTGTANAAIVKPLEYAAISGVTLPASDYTDTITYVGAGSF